MKGQITERIKNIPDDGWYKEGNRQAFMVLYTELKRKGFSEDEAIEFLESCYSIVSDEYGN